MQKGICCRVVDLKSIDKLVQTPKKKSDGSDTDTERKYNGVKFPEK